MTAIAEFTVPDKELDEVSMTISITMTRSEWGIFLGGEQKTYPGHCVHDVVRDAVGLFDELRGQSFKLTRHESPELLGSGE